MDGIFDYVMARLKDSGRTYAQIAAGSGVKKRTVAKIARGEIKDPGVSHIEAMARYFRGLDAQAAERHQRAGAA